jgi:hypothetical protein
MTEATTLSPATLTAEVDRFWETYGEEAASLEHWANIRKLDEEVRRELQGKVDLSRIDQETEAQLYTCVVLEFFTPRPLAEPGAVVSAPLYSPQQAGLRVFFERGKWHAGWTRLEEPLFQPVEVRWQWITIENAEPGFLRFRDCTTPLLQGRGDRR